MPKRHTYDDGVVIDLDDDIKFEDLPEGEDNLSDQDFDELLAAAEAREAASAPSPEAVEDSPDGVRPEDL